MTTGPVVDTTVQETGLLGLLLVMARRKRLVLGLPVAAVVLAVGISLLLPNIFRAATKILPPQQAQGGAAALLVQLGGVAGAAAGAAGIKNPNDLYIGMIKSRTIADNLVRQFELMKVYDLDSFERTRKALEKNTIVSTGKDGLITIEVEDEDKKLAAALANAYVAQLLKLTGTLALTEAAQRRVFFESQLELTKNKLATAEMKLKQELDANGVISVDGDSRAMVETVGRVRARISAKEIELNAMKAFVTSNNQAHMRVEEELKSLRAELFKLENGRPMAAGSPVEKAGTGSGLKNIVVLRDVKYHEMLYELLAKQYELARLDEAKDAPLIQVLDPAIEPERKVKPARSLIVLITGFVSLLLAIGLAFLLETRQRALRVPALAAQWQELRTHLPFGKRA